MDQSNPSWFLRYIVVIGICVASFLVINSFWGPIAGIILAGIMFLIGLLIIHGKGGFVRTVLIVLLIGAIVFFAYTTAEAGVAKKGWWAFGELRWSAFEAKYNEYTNLLKAKLFGYGEWTNPQAVEKKIPVGIKIKDITPTRDAFISGEDEIEIMANARIYGLEDISPKITFGCEIEDEKGNMILAKKENIEISGQETNEVFAPIGEDELYQIRCTFDKMSLASDKDNEVRGVKVKAEYSDFATRSNVIVYTLKKDIAKEIGDVNPFEYFRIQDSKNLDKDGVAIPHKEVKAPVELWLNMPVKQPFIEDINYFIGLKLNHDQLSWGGNLKKIKFLKLIYPENIAVREEKCTDFTEELTLKDSELEKINRKLETEKDIEVYINDIKYFCDFTVVEAGEVPESSFIRAQIVYDYEFVKTSSINLVKREEYAGLT